MLKKLYKFLKIIIKTGVRFDKSQKNPEKWIYAILGLPLVERTKPH